MKRDIHQEFIEDILQHSKNVDKELHGKIEAFIDIYDEQIKQNEKITKENNFFIRKWDKRNILDHEKKDKIIEQQSRLAAMGEMIDAIAHQWKQPLNAISMVIDMLKDDYKKNIVDTDYVEDLGFMVHTQIEHMVTTLNEFRNFLRPSTKNENFHINTIIQNIKILMRDELIAQNLHINLDIDNDVEIFGNKNEFKHLFINLINNSIDAFNEKNISSRELHIRCFKNDNLIKIEVEDNAGGIREDIIEHIFKPNVTTKPEGKGTGIGLYMSSQIVNKNNGDITVKNTKTGALFTITLRELTI